MTTYWVKTANITNYSKAYCTLYNQCFKTFRTGQVLSLQKQINNSTNQQFNNSTTQQLNNSTIFPL
jgi:hypothetical protein